VRTPREPSEITPQWLTYALHLSGALPPDVRIETVDREEIGGERGFTGRVIRVRTGQRSASHDALAGQSLIAKLPLANRGAATDDGTVPVGTRATQDAHLIRSARELHFYDELATRSGVAVPRSFFAAMDLAHNRMVLLMEDLSGLRFGDVMMGCSNADAALLIDSIARLHGRWWGRDLPIPWLAGWTGDHVAAQVRLQRNVARLPDHVVATFPGDIREILHWLAAGAYERVLDALSAAPRTLIHGDLHLDNIAFRDSSRAATPVITDWQTVGVGPAVVDLAACLSGALDVAERTRVEADLLASYHDGLLAAGVSDYSRALLERDYGLALVRQLAGVFGWLANTELADLGGRERDVTLAAIGDGRLIAALRDHDPMSLLSR